MPTVDLIMAKNAYKSVIHAIDRGFVKACHDCSEGGLGVAASEMALAGDLGLKLFLERVPRTGIEANDKILFSESNSRLIVEVSKGKEKEFEEAMRDVKVAKIGEISDEKNLRIFGVDGSLRVDEPIISLRNAWKSTFNWWIK